MLKLWFRKLQLMFNPPRTGDVFYGDPFEFIIGRVTEHVLHGTRSIYGYAAWNPSPADQCYRLTVESDAMPYYRCTGEALCVSADGEEKAWKKRSQPRRIYKNVFHDMIAEGRLKKHE
jgi:hypothetical protein